MLTADLVGAYTEEINTGRKYTRDTFKENTRKVLLIFLVKLTLTKKRILCCYVFGDFVEEIEDFMAHLTIGRKGKYN